MFVGEKGLESTSEEELESSLMSRFEESLNIQTALVSSSKDKPYSYIQKKKIKNKIRSTLQQSLQEPSIKRVLLTLIALEECYVQDKVVALPLFLRLFD